MIVELMTMANAEKELSILQHRLTEIEAREKILNQLKQNFENGTWRDSGHKTFEGYCVKEFGYRPAEAREIAIAVGAILLQVSLTSPDPTIQARIDRLRSWRNTRAKALGIAAYRVISNRVLLEIANARDLTAANLGRVNGLGPRKLQDFGAELTALLELSPL